MYVDDMITLVNEMIEAGSTVLNEPAEMFWGDLKARVKDPFGFIWDIATETVKKSSDHRSTPLFRLK